MTTKVTILNHGPAQIVLRALSAKAGDVMAPPVMIEPGEFADVLYVHLNRVYMIEETFK